MKRLKRRIFIACVLALLVPAALFLAWKPSLLEGTGFSRAVFARDGQLLRLTLAGDQAYRLFTPLPEIPAALKEAVLLHEDRHFYSHVGINPVSMLRAFFQTYITGGRRLGASTLSMQLARIKYGINSKQVAGKLWQIARAMQLEMHYSKDELFEAYLNLAPYGYNINGIGAASFIYFHKQPRDLTLPEALTLAVLPQSPARRAPERGAPVKPALNDARNRLFARWVAEHPEDASRKIFFALPLTVYGTRDLPFDAPHVTQDLLESSPAQRVTSTINIDIQRLMEKVLHQYVRDRRDTGLQNASMILVNTQTMEVESLVGSADFHDAQIEGQVDGTRARRSPGSTLKPFIYALGLQQGVIHPASILGDAPASYGSYTPDNFERDFRGPISARNALRFSRNIPAIRLAAQLKSPDLYEFLKKSGIARLRDRKTYGLSIVLGGAEVTPRELVSLYAMLANDGVQKPLAFTRDTQKPERATLLSPEAAFMTLDMMADTPRPYGVQDPLKVYWKTGTSNGFRDAWTAGVFGHYAMVVWVGNFSGKSNPALVGLHAAAPLFFALTDAVQGSAPQHDLIAAKAKHLNLRKTAICATTGDLSLDDCPARTSTWFIPGVSPIARNDVYRKILVDMDTGKRACRMTRTTAWRTYEVWPSDLSQALQRAGINKQPLPPMGDDCDAAQGAEGQAPVILSPQPKIEYHARIDDAAEAVTFTASVDGDVRGVSWFVGNTFIGQAAAGAPLFWRPQPGTYNVRAIDDRGRSGTTVMKVSLAQ